jgi:uncharacterized repeat protein (TIGR02543 family)
MQSHKLLARASTVLIASLLTAGSLFLVAPASATGTVTQGTPTSGTTTDVNSSSFTDQLSATGDGSAVTYVTTVGSSGVSVDANGVVTTTGSLSAGSYTVSGTDSDADGDTGDWSYTLTVTSTAGPPSGGSPSGGQTLIQTSATSGSTTTPDSATFAPPPIAVAASDGAVTYTTTTPNLGLTVSSAGAITVAALLAAGTYTVSGTDHDTNGDTGTWTYTLTVTDTFFTVTFEPNGGHGTMAAQRGDHPTALAFNEFTRAGYTFVNWFTSANGTGTPYANGATYPFTAPITLYAQWKKGKVASHTVTFFANGGTGSMAPERENTATGLSNVTFTRVGYTFSNWSTTANGKGKSFANRVTYSFKASLSLYAQWTKKKKGPAKPEFTVTFAANGGAGAMASEVGRAPAALNQVTFTRAGYTFVSWNTKATGSGANYANRAEFPFSANATLYAQWKKIKKTAPPPPPIIYGGLILGPFAAGSSTLTPGLESQIRDIVGDVKSKGKSQIALLGFGDNLSGASSSSSTNVALGRERAQAVADYLQGRLTALGLKGWSISIGAEGTGTTSSGQIESALVSVTLS